MSKYNITKNINITKKDAFWSALMLEITRTCKKDRKSHFLNIMKKKYIDDDNYSTNSFNFNVERDISSLSSNKLFSYMIIMSVCRFYEEWEFNVYTWSKNTYGDITNCVWAILNKEIKPVVMSIRNKQKHLDKTEERKRFIISENIRIAKKNAKHGDRKIKRNALRESIVVDLESSFQKDLPESDSDADFVRELTHSLCELASLRENGYLNENEFNKAKNMVLCPGK